PDPGGAQVRDSVAIPCVPERVEAVRRQAGRQSRAETRDDHDPWVLRRQIASDPIGDARGDLERTADILLPTHRAYGDQMPRINQVLVGVELEVRVEEEGPGVVAQIDRHVLEVYSQLSCDDVCDSAQAGDRAVPGDAILQRSGETHQVRSFKITGGDIKLSGGGGDEDGSQDPDHGQHAHQFYRGEAPAPTQVRTRWACSVRI